MNILIISTEYTKRFSVGSVRPVEMSKYFIDKGHNVTVILPGDYSSELDKDAYCELSQKVKIINAGNPEFEFSNTPDNSSTEEQAQSPLKKLAFKILPDSFIRFVFDTRIGMIDKAWIKKVQKYIDESLDIKSFDIVFTTAPSERASAIGYYIKKKYNISWVCDFRDLMVQGYQTFLTNLGLKTRQNRYIRTADAVTLVSRGTMKQLSKYKDKIHFIPNGYDGTLGTINMNASGKLKFAYTGILYDGQRDLSMLFEVLKKLIDNKLVKKEDLVFNYAGKEGNILKSQADKYNLSDIIKDYGYVSRKEALNLQQNSDFLTIVSWNTKENIGVIPAKIYEYMIAAKPVISVVSGDVPDAELSFMVEDMSLGCACEYLNYENSVNKLYDYLLKQIESAKETGEYIYNPDYDKMKFYKRETTAENMLKLFEKLTSEGR